MGKSYLSKPEESVYPNQPLIEVAMEVRFKGELQIESSRAEFYEKIRDIYPDIYTPRAVDGKSPPLQHYQFQNPDNKTSVRLAINSFGYSESKYQGSAKFINESTRLYNLLNHLCEVRRITRIGWRYTNLIPFVRESGCIPILNILNSSLVSFAVVEDICFSKIDFNSSFQLEEASVNFILGSAVNNQNVNEEALILDIDVFFDKNSGYKSKFDDVNVSLNYLHIIARNIFEDTITQGYRNYLKGDSYD